MEIYIVRHGDAEPRVSGLAEADRKLTPKGKRDTERMARLAAAMNVRPDITLTSPYRRAKETAAIVLNSLKSDKLVETSTLLPEEKPEQVWKEIRSHAKAREILVVGHEPQLSAFVAYLLDSPDLTLDFKKSALVRIQIDKLGAAPEGEWKWIVTPGLIRSYKKLVK